MQKIFTIIDENGIHARPATALVSAAMKFNDVELYAEATGIKINLKSILGLLSLDLYPGDALTLIAEGNEENEALSTLHDVMIKEGLGVLHD
ncbi:HPr family phosphocarrier protein [Paenibacillus sp. FSL H8-0537]|uniref:HPr family phosphocarrier protein n=1 Tax=Paenibacillus sp. FSL H8-0537 TaxID=2921399 RepID=UPI003101812F